MNVLLRIKPTTTGIIAYVGIESGNHFTATYAFTADHYDEIASEVTTCIISLNKELHHQDEQ